MFGEKPVESVSIQEVEIDLNVKLEGVPKFCYLGDTLGARRGVEYVARARDVLGLSSRSYLPF